MIDLVDAGLSLLPASLLNPAPDQMIGSPKPENLHPRDQVPLTLGGRNDPLLRLPHTGNPYQVASPHGTLSFL
jgi:hypothetical protein